MSEQIENQKIEKRLTTLEVLAENTKKDVAEIKERVFNHIPHQISELKDRIFFGFLIGIAAMIIAQILLKFLK